jgi:hypothetical protein
LSWIERHVGRRGAFLLFLALVDLLYGYSQLTTPTSIVEVFSSTTWGWIWIGIGVVLTAGAFVHRDRAAFGLAAFIKAAWAGMWVDVWISDAHVPRAWVSVVIWGAFAGVVLVVSTWPEVHPAQRSVDGE